MSVKFHLTGRWRMRLESAHRCAERLAAMISALAPLHPVFERWNEQASSRDAATRPFCAMPPQVDELARLFAKNPNERGFPFGYRVHPWNGKDPPYGAALTVSAGDGRDLYYFPNSAEIILPVPEPTNVDLLNLGVMKPAFLAMISAWEPQFCKLQPWGYGERWSRAESWNDADKVAHRRDGYLPRITSGWMIYLCADYARRIIPPCGIEVEPVAGGGLILLATREVFTPGNPAHDAAADAIQEALLPLQNLPHKETN